MKYDVDSPVCDLQPHQHHAGNGIIGGLSNKQDFFEVLRRIERAKQISLDDIGDWSGLCLRVVQPADMSFAPREVYSIEQQEGCDDREWSIIITCRHFGLFAPYGPLPIHMTDHARQEVLIHRNKALQTFSALLSQRFSFLHYRAWAKMNVALCHEKPQRDAFLGRLQQLSGLSHVLNVNTHIERVRTRYAAACLPLRGGLKQLQQILCAYFKVPVSISPRNAKWIDDEQSCVHQKMGHLGRTRLGRRFFDVQHSARVCIGPLGAPQYLDFMRKGERLKVLHGICQDFTSHQMVFAIDLLIRTTPDMSITLGNKRLGTDGWLKAKNTVCKKNVYQ